MFRNIRIDRVLHYSAEGMIAWIPSVIVSATFHPASHPAFSSLAIYAHIVALLMALMLIRRFVEPGYRLIAGIEGYLLVGAIVALSARI